MTDIFRTLWLNTQSMQLALIFAKYQDATVNRHVWTTAAYILNVVRVLDAKAAEISLKLLSEAGQLPIC